MRLRRSAVSGVGCTMCSNSQDSGFRKSPSPEAGEVAGVVFETSVQALSTSCAGLIASQREKQILLMNKLLRERNEQKSFHNSQQESK